MLSMGQISRLNEHPHGLLSGPDPVHVGSSPGYRVECMALRVDLSGDLTLKRSLKSLDSK
jgi:hypothetical protein